MSETEKAALSAVASGVNGYVSAADESTILAITAGYLAGKEAGKKAAIKEKVASENINEEQCDE